MKPVKGIIKGGVFRPFATHYYNSNIKALEGKTVVLSIRTPESQRTIDANKYYWFLITSIAEYSGHTKKELHEFFKDEFLSEQVVVFGKRLNKRKSTTELSIKAFYIYCENILAYMGSLGFILPSKTDWEQL
jgi:hypothetical protein